MGGVGKDGTTYTFASSNPMWRATLEILDFLPLANVDYSGGIITTDWYNEGTASNEAIKITIRFLTKEVTADGLRIIVHKKKCNIQQKCTVRKISSDVFLVEEVVEKRQKPKSTKAGRHQKRLLFGVPSTRSAHRLAAPERFRPLLERGGGASRRLAPERGAAHAA